MIPFEKSSKCSVIDSHEVIGPIVGPAESANQPMIQKSRKTTNVTTPATIWLFVVLEMNSPIEMNAAPISSSPRYPADDQKEKEDHNRPHAGDVRVVRRTGDEHPDRDERGPHQQHPEIPRQQRPPLGVAVDEQDRHVEQRHRENHDIKTQRSEELA